MQSQKIENLLNLALDATGREREKSEMLEEGYDPEKKSWRVIVRYHGDLKAALGEIGEVIELTGGYAILTIPKERVRQVAELPEIDYMEKPKRLYFELQQARKASCVSALQSKEAGLELYGEGVLVAVIDSGVDYFHPDFRMEDGSTRILAIWDQSAALTETKETTPKEDGSAPGPPEGFLYGIEYTKKDIDAALAAGSRAAGYKIVPHQDVSGHGTEVLGIAAGNARASAGQYLGIAPASPILVVKLASPDPDGFPGTTELMQGIEYVIRKAQGWELPVAVNISFGNTYGSHKGRSLLESYLDMMADRWKAVVVTGIGNEGTGDGHAAGRLREQEKEKVIEFSIGEYETVMNLQIWKNYVDETEISLISPTGVKVGPFERIAGTARYRLGTTQLLVYYGEPAPYQQEQEIYLDFVPEDTYLASGVWKLVIKPVKIVDGRYDVWMPDGRIRNPSTRMLQASPDATLTIPSTAYRTIAVGAYNSRTMAYAPFSGRGFLRGSNTTKPDLAAPGVEITTSAVGGGYAIVTGTSFAAPFVTGGAALLMQWGIVNGNDPYLYGEKIREYLRKGARRVSEGEEYPNPRVGYGVLCVRDSLPV